MINKGGIFMSDVCIIRHEGYIKTKVHLLERHNRRRCEKYSNKNIVSELTPHNTILINNLQNNETYLQAFKRLYTDGEFKGQLKINGVKDKQTKFIDEFLVYPPYDKINSMTIEEQNIFFQKELTAIQAYFPHMIILSAVIHRDELFYPKDNEMKALFPRGKVTAHMHIDAIPIVYDKQKGYKKISISELWKGKNSYRKFQDYMYKAVGREYNFERGELHNNGES